MPLHFKVLLNHRLGLGFKFRINVFMDEAGSRGSNLTDWNRRSRMYARVM